MSIKENSNESNEPNESNESNESNKNFERKKLPKILMGYRNGKRVPVSFRKDNSYKRKVSETLKRTWANRSEAYIEKRNNKLSVSTWNKKKSEWNILKVKRRKELSRKLFKIVPRESNYSGVIFK